jgi:serine/threonine protein kinase
MAVGLEDRPPCPERAGNAQAEVHGPLRDGKRAFVSEVPPQLHRQVVFDVYDGTAKKPVEPGALGLSRDTCSTNATNPRLSLNFCSDGTLSNSYGTRSSFSRRTLAGSRRTSLASLRSLRRGARKSTTESRLKSWRLLTWMQALKVNYEDLAIGEVLGEGSTANVHRGRFKQEAPADLAGEDEETQVTEVAIKEFLFDKHDYEQLAKALVRELEVLTSLNHDNLVRLIGVVEKPTCIVLELCHGGVLYDLLYNSTYRIAWEQQLKIACDIAEAMEYLHGLEPPVIHRDLKSLNCLLDEPVVSTDCEPYVKVADFGMAIRWSPVRKLTRGAGTCHWMAPEVANGTDYEAKADVFSFGMMLWEIFRLEIPFQDRSSSEASKLLGAGERPEIVPDAFPPECPEELIVLMTECWDQDPDRRPSFEHALETLDEFLPRPWIDDEDFVESAWWISPTHLGETPGRRTGSDPDMDVDDEDFVETAWWKSPTSCGLEVPITRRVCDVDDSDARGHGPDEVIWAQTAQTTYPSDGSNPQADLGSDVEDFVKNARWCGGRAGEALDRRAGLDSDSDDEELGVDAYACVPTPS